MPTEQEDILNPNPGASTSNGDDPLQGTGTGVAPAVESSAYVSDLVGPGKKYATVADLEKAVSHSQQHIAKLEQEAAQRRSAEEHNQTLEQILAKLSDGNGSSTANPSQETVAVTPASGVLSEDTIESVVQQKLEQITKKQQEDQNYQTVNKKLAEFYGAENAKKLVQEKASQLGINPVEMARKSPQALLELLGVKAQASTPARESAINSQGVLRPTGVSSDYERLVNEQAQARKQMTQQGKQVTMADRQKQYKQRIAALGKDRYLK